MADSLQALRRGDLAGASSLTLRDGLTVFPREILGLADTLERLDLSGNALASLPHDLGRLRHLRVLFCSGNRFERLPPVLGDCAALSQVGFRAAGVREIPPEALPPALRWLTLTDNAIEEVPEALGSRPLLQKLMLAGNRLRRVPDGLATLDRLELLRLSANRLEALPGWVSELPALAWLAWAGNPLDRGLEEGGGVQPVVRWDRLRMGALLGEGASGRIHHALWQEPDGAAPRAVAVKLFRGSMTSDGLPEREIAACLAAGDHPGLTGALGRLVGHPDGTDGLAMRLLPDGWRALAGPPSLESCSRDVYAPALRLAADVVRRIARAVGAAAAHLHARGLLHGDLYAHNVLWDGRGDGRGNRQAGGAILSDLGAASFLPAGADAGPLRRLDVRAWGLLLGELLACCGEDVPALRRIAEVCVQPGVRDRPDMAGALEMLAAA